MKKFINETQSTKEKAIKIGTNVPKDAVGLSWFESLEVKPKNTINIVDYSTLISENQSTENSYTSSEVAYADELGILRRFSNNNYNFPSNDLTVSNIPLSSQYSSLEINPENMDSSDYVHYKYVSRFFISAPNQYSISSETSFISTSSLSNLSIKVYDKNGKEYIDEKNSRKKYRILLEPYRTNENANRPEVPHRIVVLLDASKPDNLTLVYDKVESDDSGSIINMELSYSEPINAVQMFTEIPEESFVIDSNVLDGKKFSIKKIDDKYSQLINNSPSENGYQVVVEDKAFSDYRTYEAFNWRLIARSNVSVNVSSTDYGAISDNSNIKKKVLNVGVLYDSNKPYFLSDVHPYIFARLENSPFNLFGYEFQNPNSVTTLNSDSKKQASYWMVDISSPNVILDDYDILAWSPTSKITTDQVKLLKRFCSKSKTLILDLSSAPPDTASYFDGNFIINPVETEGVELRIENSSLTNKDKNGAWDLLVDQTYAQEYYGVWGSNNTGNETNVVNKNYRTFSDSSNSFLNIISDPNSPSKSIARFIPVLNDGDSLSRGNILVTTFSLMAYCNAIYSTSTNQVAVDNNGASTIYERVGNTYAGVVEGPFKLLFNTCAYALYSVARSSRTIDERSALFNYVSEWSPSWTMDQDAILEDEKSKYFLNISENTSTAQYARDIMPRVANVRRYMVSAFSSLPDSIKSRLNYNIGDIEVFIEVTNPSVTLSNARKISDNEKLVIDMPSSYSLYRILDMDKKTCAWTASGSDLLTIPSSYGHYAMIEKNIVASGGGILKDNFNSLESVVSYPFDLTCKYHYVVPGPEKYSEFKATIDIDLDVKYNATFLEPQYDSGEAKAPDQFVDKKLDANKPQSSIDYATNLSGAIQDVNNIYPYTGDIVGVGNATYAWIEGRRGDYAMYVQYTLWTYNNYYDQTRNYYPYSLDTYYGPKTALGVKSFQAAEGEKFIDGIVDSETKWFFAKFWRKVKSTNLDLYNKSLTYISGVNGKVYEYIVAAANTATLEDWDGNSGVNPKKSYRKITQSGSSRGADCGEDYIFFQIPDFQGYSDQPGYFNKIVIEADNDAAWRNFELIEYGLAASLSTGDFKNPSKYTISSSLIPVDADGNIVINLAKTNSGTVVNGFVKIRGKSLGGSYGTLAEGFGIKRIYIQGVNILEGKAGRPPAFDGTYKGSSKEVTLNLLIKDYLIDTRISAERNVNFDVKSSANKSFMESLFNSSAVTLKTMKYNGKTYTINEILDPTDINGYKINKKIDISNKEEDGILEVDFKPSNISSKIVSGSVDYTLSLIKSASDGSNLWDVDFDSSSLCPVTAVQSGTDLELSTSAVYFSDAVHNEVVELQLSNGYRLMSDNNQSLVYSDSRRTVDINDGVLLMCDEDGNRFGIPTVNEIIEQSSGAFNDVRLGSLLLINSYQNEGMLAGFYDRRSKEFLGDRIEYIDLLDNTKDIYIAVAALDADGNMFTYNEYIGANGNVAFKPVNIPMKYISPLYSVKMNNPSAIKVMEISPELNSHDTWFLPVTSGSFEKKINVSGSFLNSDWKNTYKGQTLSAVYSTVDLQSESKSKIYGKGYIDVYAESPIILDEKRIKARNIPILAWNHPTDYDSSIFGIVKPVIKVEVREDLSSDWREVKYSQIRSIRCSDGTIEFNSRIVPSSNSLIRISYTAVANYNLIKSVGSEPIPLNPVLDNDKISFDKPLFVYIMPTQIYAWSNSADQSGSRVRVTDYVYSNSINFTYDSSIFNKNSYLYEPFALLLAAVYVSSKPENIPPNLTDIRVRGGGIVQDIDTNSLVNELPEVLYNWDVYSSDTQAYTKGGYIIIKIPQSVKDHFVDQKEIYNIIKNNLTAGVVFELQDMDGNTWS